MKPCTVSRFGYGVPAFVLGAALGLTAAPAKADDLIVALSTFSEETLVPWAGSGQRKTYLDLVYEYLTYVDPATQETVPGLAQSWSASDDGLNWTFTLREGVTFSNGDSLTSADVAYSIERMIREDSRAGPSSVMRRAIAAVETPDDRTVVVTLNTPDHELAQGYFGASQQLGIVSKSYFDAVGEEAAEANPVGTGPYEFERLVSGSEILMVLRDDMDDGHWRASPEFDRVIFRVVPEESTRVAMLRTGEADIAPIGFDSIPTLRDAGLSIVSAPATWSPVIRFGGLVQTSEDRYNPDAPWAAREVRQALNYAVDKQEIIDALFQGEATIAASDTPVPAWENVAPYPYDPERARELLAEAGYPNGFDITLRSFTTTPGAELPLMAEAVALYWQDIGVNVTIEPIDWPALRSAWTEGRANDYVWTHRGFPFASAANGLEAGFTANSLFASYTTPELEDMIAAFGQEPDADRRTEMFTEIGQHLRDEAAAVFIALANEPYGVSAKVGDWDISTSYIWNFDQVGRAGQ
ncbi:ABC transporter substrate-binding protein [Roseinatronobacter sp.]